ncbi:Nickel transport protein NikQ [Pseudodesulfovibrio profundus]|uniref:Nickel transport protein NikQ n=1 Tax=Pseudodesulfovibrio profundus TaxID=57320 RepID=A0A2C8F5G6_9BACT|nr:cobalt ECF transporter T component CbiQ [Pseudodesulfovibrio profundus]SOB57749.1 Nickel transport protein NikQ [Pseudodesulfovibrio profundus]
MPTLGEPFAHGESLIHGIDPRIRLICATLLTVPTALLLRIDQSIAMLILGVVLIGTAQLSPARVLSRLAIVNTFIAFLWLFIPFSTPGSPIGTIGPLTVTHEGLVLSTLVTLKSNAIILTLIALLGTIKVQDLGPAMQSLKVPDKLCHLLVFTYRYIFVIHQEYQTMRQAMSARGFCPTTNTHTYRTYAWLVGMLLVKSWDRAERVHGAMMCRGFKGKFYSLASFTTSVTDYCFLMGCMVMIIAVHTNDIFKRVFV